MIFLKKLVIFMGHLSFGVAAEESMSAAAVYKVPMWSCHSTAVLSPKKYELRVYRRKGDDRFQFVLLRIKPAYKKTFDFAEGAKLSKDGYPIKTLPSKAVFSFVVDEKQELSVEGYQARLILDKSWDKKDSFNFTEKDPLILTCKKSSKPHSSF